MTNFAAARKNMVDCQIHTAGVVDPRILAAYESTPRERFLPAELGGVAYSGEDLRVQDERMILEPSVQARMIQAASPLEGDIVLDIGGVNGYSAAIWSPLVTTVIALENKQKYLDRAGPIWTDLGLCNIVGLRDKLVTGCPDQAPYDIIFLNGAVSEIPTNLVAQLSDHGRLMAVVRQPGSVMGQAVRVQRLGSQHFSTYTLFDAAASFLPGYEPKPAFRF